MKRRWSILLLLCLVLAVSGCGDKQKGEGEMYVYYLNTDGNALLQEVYPNMSLKETISKLKTHMALQKGVKLEEYEEKNGQVSLFFSREYGEMNPGKEVLLRAAFVQTLTQLNEVEFVAFYVDHEPLKDGNGNSVGLMRAEDFIQNTGSSIASYQTKDLKLFLASKDGKKLKESKKSNVRYNPRTSVERLTVESLMKAAGTSNTKPTIPKTVKLLGVSVKEGICYVNFDSKLSSDSYDLNPEVTIYSIVNSIIANGSVTKVQVLIDGASDVIYKNTVDLSSPLEWNGSITEE